MQFPIYLITCTHPSYGSNVMRYVGCIVKEGKTVEERFKEHCRSHRGYLHDAITRHGKEHFFIEQIDAGATPEQARELEKFWVAKLKTKAPCGYNLTDGGEGTLGCTPSDETRRKLSKARRGNTNKLGKKESLVTRQRKSVAMRGNRNSVGNAEQCRSIASLGASSISQELRLKGLHNRWHLGRGIVKPECYLCR